MAYSREIHEAAMKKLNQRQINSEASSKQKRNNFFLKYPRAKQIEYEISNTAIKLAKTVLNGANVKEQLEKLKLNNLKLQNELQNILKNAGLPPDYLDIHYVCNLCNDTGFIDGKQCQCLTDLLKEEAYNRVNDLSPIALTSFKSFNLIYYPTDPQKPGMPSPKKRMTSIMNYCQTYSQEFSPKSKSLLMQGGTGLGKTHLSLAIAKAVIDKGYGVIYGSVPSLLSKLEKERFNYSSDSYTEDYLIACDLLILDDLGTEFSTRFSNPTIYNIINSRIMASRPTIISTNLNMRELEKSYTDRLVSRFMENYIKLSFLGNDIRQIKINS